MAAAMPAPAPASPSTIPPSLPSRAGAEPSPASDSQQLYTPPPHLSFPPFYTLQPNASTRASQLLSWSAHLRASCAAQRPTPRYVLSAASELFANDTLRRRLPPKDARVVLEHMVARGEGEWVSAGSGSSSSSATAQDADAQMYVFWRSAAAWAGCLSEWVAGTGQRGVVLTVYELLEGEGAAGCEWRGMPERMFRRVVGVLVAEGRAVMFGGEKGGGGDGVGVKIL